MPTDFALEVFTPAGCVPPAELPGEDATRERYPTITAAADAGRALLTRHGSARGFAVSTLYPSGATRLEHTETRAGATYPYTHPGSTRGR